MFEGLEGQEYVKKSLKEALASGRTGHAYAFCGPEGIGRKSFAREFARAVMCQAPDGDGEPCGNCLSCRLFAAGNLTDLKLVTGDTGKASVGVETVRELEEDVVTAPTAGRRKVYIVDRAESLTVQAQNALLKTMEEPPEYVMIILICANPSLLIDTVRSRVTRLDFARNTDEEVLKVYKERTGNGALTDSEQSLIAAYADGIIGRGLLFTDFEAYGRLRETLFDALAEVLRSRSGFLLKFTEVMTDEHNAGRRDFMFFELASFVRDTALYAGFGDGVQLQNAQFRNKIYELAAAVDRHRWLTVLEKLDDTWLRIGQNVNYRMLIAELAAEIIGIVTDRS